MLVVTSFYKSESFGVAMSVGYGSIEILEEVVGGFLVMDCYGSSVSVISFTITSSTVFMSSASSAPSVVSFKDSLSSLLSVEVSSDSITICKGIETVCPI